MIIFTLVSRLYRTNNTHWNTQESYSRLPSILFKLKLRIHIVPSQLSVSYNPFENKRQDLNCSEI